MSTLRSIWLIACSLTLLAVFEVLWLRKGWQEQRQSLAQETDYVFQRTMMALQDSLVRRSIVRNKIPAAAGFPAPGMQVSRLRHSWGAPASAQPPAIHFDTKTSMILRVQKSKDELPLHDTTRYNNVQVFVTSSERPEAEPTAGMSRLLLNLPAQVSSKTGEQVFQIEQDTISTAELKQRYRDNLLAAGIALPFQVFQADSIAAPPKLEGIQTQAAFGGLLVPRLYWAWFPECRKYLLRKMIPTAAFAGLLFGVTTLAFGLIYRSLRQQQRLTRMKNELISNITHELKTPITTVGVALEALSDFDALQNPDKTREYLSLSKLELDRLSLLVDKVLRLSMFEEQEPRLQATALDLGDVVRQVMAALRLQAERMGAEIRLEAAPGVHFPVTGDRQHLASVVFNLLDNALKYAGPQPEIRIVLLHGPETVQLQVHDKGPGIPAEYQSKVFDKFFRVPADNRHEVKGHGLGLSYVAQVLRQHGGSIRLSSPPGGGATFWVELPACPTTTS